MKKYWKIIVLSLILLLSMISLILYFSSDGYPCYRLYRLAVSATGFDCEQKVPNSYVFLVMTEEDFLKINQDIDWDKYMS